MAEPSSEVLRVKLLSPNAQLPVRASPLAAGYDLFAAQDVLVPSHGKALVPTDIAIAVPPGHYGRIAPRSSLALKNHMDVGAGVIDEDYRGPIGVVMFNHSPVVAYQVVKGTRIAQLILERISNLPIEQVDSLDDTKRGAGGFGSTG